MTKIYIWIVWQIGSDPYHRIYHRAYSNEVEAYKHSERMNKGGGVFVVTKEVLFGE